MKTEKKEIETISMGITDIFQLSFDGIKNFNEILLPLGDLDPDELQPGTITKIYYSFRTIIKAAEKEMADALDYASKNLGELRFKKALYNQTGIDPEAILGVELDTRFVEKKESVS